MAEEDVNVKFGASIDDLKDKLGEVQDIFKKVTERFAVMAAVVAGGAAFKEFINATNELNGEATKLSKTLGITGDEAGVLNTALGDVGASADDYTGAFLKFNRQLRAGGDEMKAMGVDVDALKTGQKDSNQVFQEAIRLIGTYKPGVDQTQAAMKILGRNVEDAGKFLKLFGGSAEDTASKLEEARKKNEELNLNITTQGLSATKAYKAAMNDVGDVMMGLKKTIGEAVIPIFTEMANNLAEIGPDLVAGTKAAVETFIAVWQTLRQTVAVVWDAVKEIASAFSSTWRGVFGEDGPGAMQIFKNALALVQMAAIGFRIGVEVVLEAVKTGFVLLGETLTNWAAMADRIFHFDFAGAKATWRNGLAEREKMLAESGNRMVAIAEKGREDLDKVMMSTSGGGPTKASTPAGAPAGGDKKFEIKDSKGDAEAVKLAQAKLALAQATNASSLSLQLEYLKQYQSQLDVAYKNNLVSDKAYYDAKLAGELVAADAVLEAKRKELEEQKKLQSSTSGNSSAAEKLKFAAQEQKILGEINVLEAKRADTIRANADAYKSAEQQRTDAMNSIAATAAKAKADVEVSTERGALDQMLALRQISAADAFAVEQQLEQKSYEATLSALKAKGDAIHGTEAAAMQERAALDAEAEAAHAAHEQKLTSISNAAEVERSKYSLEVMQQSEAGFAQMIGAMIEGTLTLSQAFKNMGKFIEQTFVNLIAKKFAEQLFDTAGLNDAISSVVNFVTEGVTKIIKMFIRSETEETAAKKVGSVQRKAIQTTETTTAIASTETKTTAAIASTETEVAAVETGAVAKIAADEGASGASIAATAASAIANIAAKAWEVAASVYSALAGIPYVGPFLAPVAAIAATAVVLGFIGRIASSEGGEYKVGEDRLNFVHKNETILPAPFAEGLRRMIDSSNTAGNEGHKSWWQVPKNPLASLQNVSQDVEKPAPAQQAQSQQPASIYLNVSAVDGASVKKLFMENGPALAKSLQNQARNFKKV